MTTSHSSRHTRALMPIALVATFLSGAAGLSYEVIWSRMLVIPLGNAADATALVLFAFMLGMAVGARVIGGLADRLINSLRIYVATELCLAIYAATVPFFMPHLEHLMAQNHFAQPLVSLSFRFMVASVVVLPPALLMGAAVPVLVRSLAKDSDQIAHRIGWLYGTNTLGGAAGALLCGYYSIAHLGLMASSWLGAFITLIAALLVLLLVKSPASVTPQSQPVLNTSTGQNQLNWFALVGAGISGFVMLGAEVLFARTLTYVFGHDTYAFATLLVLVLTGLGLGSLLFTRLRHFDHKTVLAAALLFQGVSLLISWVGFGEVVVHAGRDPFNLAQSDLLATSLWVELGRELVLTPLLVLAPALAAGVALPAAAAMAGATNPAQAGSRVGLLFLVNGIVAGVGSLAVGLLLIGTMGMANTMVLLAFCSTGFSLVAFLGRRKHTDKRNWVLVAVTLLVMTATATAGHTLPQKMFLEAVGAQYQKILFYKEGRTGTVSVTQNRINGERQLFVNAVNEVTTRLVHDQSFKMLGHLAPLLHPNPKSGLMICFGAGMAAGAAITHPLKSLDIVDLSSVVWQAAPYFKIENNQVLSDPRVHPHINDGRQFLLSSNRSYDVMMVDSTHPKSVDSWILYTTGFYRQMRAHLNKGGIAVQWLPLHGLSEREFKTIVATFRSVFPEMTMWVNVGFETYGQAAYAKLVGTREPLKIDFKELALRLKEPAIAKDLAPYGMNDPFEILDTFTADAGAIAQWVGNVPLQTDDRPFVPYITFESRGPRMSPAAFLSMRKPVWPLLTNMGTDEPKISARLKTAFEATGFLMNGDLEGAARVYPESQKIKLFRKRLNGGRAYYLALAQKMGDNGNKLFEVGNYLGNQGYPKDAIRLYKKALAQHPNSAPILVNLALAYGDMGWTEAAHRTFDRALGTHRENPLVLYNYGVFLLGQGDGAGAAELLADALRQEPDLWQATLSLADAYREMDQLDKAAVLLQGMDARMPDKPEIQDSLGLIDLSRGRLDRAARHFRQSLTENPYRADGHYNMGLLLLKQKKPSQATLAFRTALSINPNDAEAENNLGLALGAMGQYEEAAAHHTRALDIYPHFAEAAYNLGLAHKQMGHTMAAANAFSLALAINPELSAAGERLNEMGLSGTPFQVETKESK